MKSARAEGAEALWRYRVNGKNLLEDYIILSVS